MNVWELLADRFPFDVELAEVPEINRRFGLSGEVAFSADLRPSFFVGDADGEADILLIGLKPGLSSASSIAFAHERDALRGSFDAYRRSRTNYFLSAGLNARHYWPTAKAAATMRGDPFPARLGEYLNKYVVQAELVPFFPPHAGLDARGSSVCMRNLVAGSSPVM